MPNNKFTPLQQTQRTTNLLPNPEDFAGWIVGLDTVAIANIPGTPGPFGLGTARELAGDGAVGDEDAVWVRQLLTTFPAAPTFSLFSVFVKKPTAGTPADQFSVDIKDEINSVRHQSLWEWNGDKPELVQGEGGGEPFLEEWQDGWWRIGVGFQCGRGADSGDTDTGDSRRMYVRLRDTTTNQAKNLWIYGALLTENTSGKHSDYLNGAGPKRIFFYPPTWSADGVLTVSAAPAAGFSTTLWGRPSKLHPWTSVQVTTQADLVAGTKQWTGLQLYPEMKMTFSTLTAGDIITATLFD